MGAVGGGASYGSLRDGEYVGRVGTCGGRRRGYWGVDRCGCLGGEWGRDV